MIHKPIIVDVKNLSLRWIFIILFSFTTLSIFAQTKRIYFIGNSVTDILNYDGFQEIAESKGNTHVWGRHMIPGAPLGWIWAHPADGFSQGPYGLYPSALGNFTWDAISLSNSGAHDPGH